MRRAMNCLELASPASARVFTSAAALLLSFSTHAYAQQEPAPADTVPVEAAPTEAAPTEAAPAEATPVDAAPVEAAPSETAPLLAVQPAPIVDERPAMKRGWFERPLRWRGTSFTWNQAVTTTKLGIGEDFISRDHQYYGWDFSFTPNLYLVDLPKDKLSVNADLGWNTELTNGTTIKKRETLLRDFILGTSYRRSLWASAEKAPEWETGLSLSGRLAFPTSRASQAQGKYLTGSLGANLSQKVRLLGQDAKGLNSLGIGLGATWTHLYSRSYTPVSDEVVRLRQNASGRTLGDNTLGTASFDINRVTLALTLDLPLVEKLSAGAAFRWIHGFKHAFSDELGCVTLLSGECVKPADNAALATVDQKAQTHQQSTSFQVNLSYPIYDIVELAVGYDNSSHVLADDGTRRNFFYSPDAQFYLDVSLKFDGIYLMAKEAAGKRRARQEAAQAVREQPRGSF
jgi:hypothetical protein